MFSQMLRKYLIGLSLANMVLISVWLKFFYKVTFYVRSIPTAKSFIALMLNELLLGLVFWAGYRLAKHSNNRFVMGIAKFILGLLVLLFLYIVAICFKDYVDTTYVTWILLLAALILTIRKQMTKTMVKLILLLSPFAAIIFMQSITGIIADLHKEKPAPVEVFAASKSDTPRVLWIIFDEMDYQLAFPERDPKIRLPQFDRLVKESFSAENAVAPSNHTLTSVPAMIDGKILSNVEIKDIDKLNITYKDSKETVLWGSRPNLFSRARALKFNTALVGDYVPYSRLIGKDLTYCFWTPFRYDFVSTTDTILEHMKAQLYGLAINPILPYMVQKSNYRDALLAAQDISADPKYGLSFIHFPIPHSPFIYNCSPWENYYFNPSGYNGNLVLADLTLGKVRRNLEQNGLWDRTTILISADHWLRDVGKTDYRVPYIIKLAHQTGPVSYKKHFNTILTHDLLLALLRKEIVTQADLVNWLDQHKVEQLKPEMIPMD
jgi:hypothetical protein